MKNSIKFLAIAAMAMIVTTGNSYAQDVVTNSKPVIPEMRKGMKNLTEEQKVLVENAKVDREAARETFKATMTEEQKAILTNKDLTRQARQDAFKASLTETQSAMRDANKAASNAFKESLQATFTEEQKAKIESNQAKRQAKLETMTDDQKTKTKNILKKKNRGNK